MPSNFFERIAEIRQTAEYFSELIILADQMAFLTILKVLFLAVRTDISTVGVCVRVIDHNKKDITNLRFTVEDLIVYSRINMTVSI